MTSAIIQEKTALYRHYNDIGDLLYVGVSIYPVKRFSEHIANSEWAMDSKTMTIEWCRDREAALTAEKIAIKKEKPKYNAMHGTFGVTLKKANNITVSELCDKAIDAMQKVFTIMDERTGEPAIMDEDARNELKMLLMWEIG